MQTAVLERVYADAGDFRRCRLDGANLRGASLQRARFRDAYLDGVSLDAASVAGADFRETSNLTCNQLTMARGWQLAYRDADLECGASIPDNGGVTIDVPVDHLPVTDFPPTVATSSSSESSGRLHGRVVTERAELIELAHLIVEQTRINITALRDQRLNSPEANEVIERLEETIKAAQELEEGLEKDEPPEVTEDRIKQLLSNLFDALERYFSSDRAIRTAVAGVAVIAGALCGVTPIAQVILAASAVGDPGVLKGARDLIKAFAGDKKEGDDKDAG